MNSFRGFLFYAALPAMAFWSTEVLGFTDFGQGRPVTTRDLSGKSFCYSNGVRTSYGANGKWSNSRGKHGPWSVPEPELFVGVYKGRRADIQMEITSDGRLHSYFYCLVCGDHDHDSWATPCN
jgi:hypothetical protein